MTPSDRLLNWFASNLPQLSPGLREARQVDPLRFDRLAEQFLGWAYGMLGERTLDTVCRGYAQFTNSVNFHQARYEQVGRYEATGVDGFHQELYDQPDRMTNYLWGVYLTLFAWPHHLKLAKFYETSFLPRLSPGDRIVELAFGHGGWGLWALSATEGTTLDGSDISASSVEMATGLAAAANLSSRATYRRQDALEGPATANYQAAICGFVVEHLEQPERLLQSLAAHLKPGGWLFLTGALTAAQEDHIFEFRRESELVLLAEQAGFRVLETMSEGPTRTLPNAHYLPRSMALVARRLSGELW